MMDATRRTFLAGIAAACFMPDVVGQALSSSDGFMLCGKPALIVPSPASTLKAADIERMWRMMQSRPLPLCITRATEQMLKREFGDDILIDGFGGQRVVVFGSGNFLGDMIDKSYGFDPGSGGVR